MEPRNEFQQRARRRREKDQRADEIRFDEHAADSDQRRKEKRHAFGAAAGDAANEPRKVLPDEPRPARAVATLLSNGR